MYKAVRSKSEEGRGEEKKERKKKQKNQPSRRVVTLVRY
jgi:hypothetical protein